VLGHLRLRRSPQQGTPLFLARRAQGVAHVRSGDDGGTLVGCLSLRRGACDDPERRTDGLLRAGERQP
jgi:hypothetical protein